MNFIHNITVYLLDHDIQTMLELEMEIILHVEASIQNQKISSSLLYK